MRAVYHMTLFVVSVAITAVLGIGLLAGVAMARGWSIHLPIIYTSPLATPPLDNAPVERCEVADLSNGLTHEESSKAWRETYGPNTRRYPAIIYRVWQAAGDRTWVRYKVYDATKGVAPAARLKYIDELWVECAFHSHSGWFTEADERW